MIAHYFRQINTYVMEMAIDKSPKRKMMLKADSIEQCQDFIVDIFLLLFLSKTSVNLLGISIILIINQM